MQSVTSREYKLILAPDRFLDRLSGLKQLFAMVEQEAKESSPAGVPALVKNRIGRQDEIRTTHYLDTPEHDLFASGFNLRDRTEWNIRDDGTKEGGEGTRKLTLKLRTCDRKRAIGADLSAPDRGGRAKLEEDVLPARRVFSKSTTLKAFAGPLRSVGDLIGVFPMLPELQAWRSRPLLRVRDRTFIEPFHSLCTIRFGSGGTVIRAGVSFWYQGEACGRPAIAELAYTNEATNGAFHADTEAGAERLFEALQAQPGWFDPNGTTKTRFAYG